MNTLNTSGNRKLLPVVSGLLLAALLASQAASAETSTTADQGKANADNNTLRTEMRLGAGQAVEETRSEISDALTLRLLGGPREPRLAASPTDRKRG